MQVIGVHACFGTDAMTIPEASTICATLGNNSAPTAMVDRIVHPGDATAAFDELAIINWEDEIVAGNELATPHARDFIRVQGSAGSQIELNLSFTRYHPAD